MFESQEDGKNSGGRRQFEGRYRRIGGANPARLGEIHGQPLKIMPKIQAMTEELRQEAVETGQK